MQGAGGEGDEYGVTHLPHDVQPVAQQQVVHSVDAAPQGVLHRQHSSLSHPLQVGKGGNKYTLLLVLLLLLEAPKWGGAGRHLMLDKKCVLAVRPGVSEAHDNKGREAPQQLEARLARVAQRQGRDASTKIKGAGAAREVREGREHGSTERNHGPARLLPLQ